MEKWHKTGCVLCAQNCGLLVQIEDNRIITVKGDPDNPRSRRYLCRKGRHIASFQHHRERLTHPLKKTDDGFIDNPFRLDGFPATVLQIFLYDILEVVDVIDIRIVNPVDVRVYIPGYGNVDKEQGAVTPFFHGCLDLFPAYDKIG